jgi:methionyl-tRNA formyltransferase
MFSACKITLFIMTKKGFSVLENIISNKKHGLIEKVVIGRDGKVINDYSSDIGKLCGENGIKHCFRTENIEVVTEFAFAVSWKWLIKADGFRLIVLHDSLLPGYRGFAPLVSALKNGEKEAGVTAIFAEESYDKGPIILQKRLEITYPSKISELIDRIALLYDEIVMQIIGKIEKGHKITGKKQDEKLASYSLWLDDEDYFINWHHSSEQILRFINAVGEPYRGACSFLKKRSVRILSAEVHSDVKIENRTPGKIIYKEGDLPVVVCGEGLLKITRLTNDRYENLLPLKELRLRFSGKRE